MTPKNLINWKKQFLENMSLAFDKSTVVKEYKQEIDTLQKDKDELAKKFETSYRLKEKKEEGLIDSDLYKFQTKKSIKGEKQPS